MKNQIYRSIAIFVILLGATVAGVKAQAPSKVVVDIPFEFSAGKATLKPGVYSVKRMSGNLLALRSTDGKSAVILNAPVTLSTSDPKSSERLVFKKYNDQYVLAQIWLTVDSGRECSPTGRQPSRSSWRSRCAQRSRTELVFHERSFTGLQD
jgi:hypothetical protein